MDETLDFAEAFLDPDRVVNPELHDSDKGEKEKEDISKDEFYQGKQQQNQSNESLFVSQRRVTIQANNGSLSVYDEDAARILSSVSSREEFLNDVHSQPDAWREGITNLVESQTALRDQLRHLESTLEDTRTQLGQVQSHPPPKTIDEDEDGAEYEAEEIVDSTIDKRRKDSATGRKGCLMYKIKYRGDDKWNSKPSWQPWEDTIGCPYLVADYHHREGDSKPGPHSSFRAPSDWKTSSIQDL